MMHCTTAPDHGFDSRTDTPRSTTTRVAGSPLPFGATPPPSQLYRDMFLSPPPSQSYLDLLPSPPASQRRRPDALAEEAAICALADSQPCPPRIDAVARRVSETVALHAARLRSATPASVVFCAPKELDTPRLAAFYVNGDECYRLPTACDGVVSGTRHLILYTRGANGRLDRVGVVVGGALLPFAQRKGEEAMRIKTDHAGYVCREAVAALLNIARASIEAWGDDARGTDLLRAVVAAEERRAAAGERVRVTGMFNSNYANAARERKVSSKVIFGGEYDAQGYKIGDLFFASGAAVARPRARVAAPSPPARRSPNRVGVACKTPADPLRVLDMFKDCDAAGLRALARAFEAMAAQRDRAGDDADSESDDDAATAVACESQARYDE